MDLLRQSVLKHARHAHEHLSAEEWLKLSRLCQQQRYEFTSLITDDREVTPVTYMRIAVGLEQVGYHTRLSELDSDTRMLVMDLGKCVFGEIKDYFPKEWHRVHFTNYVCRGEQYTSDMREKVKVRAKELRQLGKLSDKPKVDASDALYLRIRLGHQPVEVPNSSPQSRPTLPEPTHSAQRSGDEDGRGFATAEERFKVLASDLSVLAKTFLDGNEQARDRLRKEVGQDNIFQLKNQLSRLCGSKAFGNRQ